MLPKEMLGMALGSWPDWVAAVAGAIAAFLSLRALKVAHSARDDSRRALDDSKSAADTAKEALEIEKARDQRADHERVIAEAKEAQRAEAERQRAVAEAARADSARLLELERDRRAQAGSLQAWWVTNSAPGRNDGDWGVVLANTSHSVFRCVEVGVKGAKGGDIVVPVVPPGTYLVLSGWDAWDWPVPLEQGMKFKPVTQETSKAITSLSYDDPIGSRWEWRPDIGLRVLKPSA